MQIIERSRLIAVAWVIPLGVACIMLAGVSGAVALVLGIAIAQLGLNRDPERWGRWAHRLLQISIIGLGAGIDLPVVAQAGVDGFGITFVSISLILLCGSFIGRLFKVPVDTSLLICAGTAICGGSAIAAVAGVTRPRGHHMATALGVVFSLNAVALVVFPMVGHYFDLSQTLFGWWAALAIHDTSSVVGAGLAYGPDALLIATTVKLARSLWIIPVACVAAYFTNCNKGPDETDSASSKMEFPLPWFILGFILMATVVWLFPELKSTGQAVFHCSQRALTAALFLIGVGMLPAMLKQVGWRPLALGIALWIPTSVLSLLVLKLMAA